MKPASFLSAALVVTSLLAPQAALAAGGDPNPVCSDFPRMGLEYALGSYASVGLDPDLEDALDDHLTDIVTQHPGETIDQITKGAVVMVARHSKIVYHKAIGLRDGNTLLGGSPTQTMPTNAIFDLQSMTKPFTAAVLLEMAADGVIDLDDLVIDYLPDFADIEVAGPPPTLALDPNKSSVTIRDMLRYMGGLDVDSADFVYGVSDPYLMLSHEPSVAAPGTSVLYSDITYRLLAHLAEVAYADVAPTPKTFRQLVSHYVTGPLQLADTDYEPVLTMAIKMPRVAGTGYFSHYDLNPAVPAGYRRGEVQDDQDWWTQRHNAMFPSVAPTGAGCDGLFSTALDLGKFAQALLDNGQVWNPANCAYEPVLSSATVAGLTHIQTVDGDGDPLGNPSPTAWWEDLLSADKAYGFELNDGVWSVGGSALSGVFKTGGAGTFLIIDPSEDLFIVVLTNHGLPDMADFLVKFDEMLEEIGPHRIADSVADAITSSGSGSGSSS
ncbi:CubicO group peptidase, beta-lactamase class C family [Nannocystis exedens]|uniref:CubicO group peptidase, beta-lactamase class C family n=1 Tax=Nannocystis exedens TaxID=54 RepID=A0A1I2H3B8_9BACT|nr:serine hydrolase domain-containing protein [Nannocystis exedens]PCC74008.1 serine hydrolase [Nannocystis exedens]SFF24635.1 CubicO group peptidase, beta-lactamase class C family [Nannocystis exedens]